jgi:hypothetical protein
MNVRLISNPFSTLTTILRSGAKRGTVQCVVASGTRTRTFTLLEDEGKDVTETYSDVQTTTQGMTK